VLRLPHLQTVGFVRHSDDEVYIPICERFIFPGVLCFLVPPLPVPLFALALPWGRVADVLLGMVDIDLLLFLLFLLLVYIRLTT
jgi:hypothetical protein